MKIIAMCNDKLMVFAENMIESLRRVGAEVKLTRIDDPPGEFATPAFRKICYRKLEMITAELAFGEPLLYTDVDVVFRRNPLEDLEKRLASCDAVFQREEPSGSKEHKQRSPHLFCAGFFAVKPTVAGKALVAPKGEEEENRWEWHSDQGLLGTRLLRTPLVAAVEFLPGELYPSGWYQRHTKISAKRFACHYNWTVSAESKIKRMRQEGDWLI